MRRLILRNFQSPGDIVMMTAAVRDLHLTHPGQFQTDVRTNCRELWDWNPFITEMDDEAEGVEVIDCEYPLIHQSRTLPYHFVHGFTQHLEAQLGVRIKPTAFRGDIHLAPMEKLWPSQVEEITGSDAPFWVVNAGGKYDYTAKWWSHERYQRVVDHFQGRIRFVQIGAAGHEHRALSGVIDLRGKTDLRQLVRLVHHAQGVLCPVTAVMHLAAAVETRPGALRNRPCVVIAGGREPPHWEAYPTHQYLHRMGLTCADVVGCWRSRTVPLGDGSTLDAPGHICMDVVGDLPRCMHMIAEADVIRAIESYFEGGALRFL